MSCCKPEKTGKALCGIKCSVDSCYYNNCDGCCTAKSIDVNVKNSNGNRSADCTTYTQR